MMYFVYDPNNDENMSVGRAPERMVGDRGSFSMRRFSLLQAVGMNHVFDDSFEKCLFASLHLVFFLKTGEE